VNHANRRRPPASTPIQRAASEAVMNRVSGMSAMAERARIRNPTDVARAAPPNKAVI